MTIPTQRECQASTAISDGARASGALTEKQWLFGLLIEYAEYIAIGHTRVARHLEV